MAAGFKMLRPSIKECEEDILAQQEKFLKSKDVKFVNILEEEPKGWSGRTREAKPQEHYGMPVIYRSRDFILYPLYVNRRKCDSSNISKEV